MSAHSPDHTRHAPASTPSTGPERARRGTERNGHYGRLLLMIGLSFVAMFVLMYAMVNSLANVYLNVNQVYMAGLMAAPMVIIELLLMRSMYPNKRNNAVILGTGVVALIAFWLFVRQQAAVSDTQFLRSMIPHHASAILMCKRASLQRSEVKSLCSEIVSSQQSEIERMRAMLATRGTPK